ncbi:hypothetical protein KJ966_11525 [bacterium]|nr:hypothetical protein [bacterium]
MKTVIKKSLLFVFLVFSLFCVAQTGVSGDMASIVGTINDNFQIVTDEGDVYFIGDTEKGAEVENLSGAQIEATGEIVEMDGDVFILINSYLITENPAG